MKDQDLRAETAQHAEPAALVCPECVGKLEGIVSLGCDFVACAACHWTQTPAEDLLIAAAVETYRRNQPKEGTK